MTDDARFEDAHGGPLRLRALDGEDLAVIAGLVQDSVFPISEMRWDRGHRRFALLLNRIRREDGAALRGKPERVQTVLAFEDVQSVQTMGVNRADGNTVLSLLSVEFEPGEDGTGTVLLTLAGDGAIRVGVEALEATLRDVTRPYLAPSGKLPDHGI
ncbi:DUF2948 family protein [Palleronia caenipelagi]|uniref:DUF2948 family protein n=1 Tax=Palleronia caenipelagi TaxID=2489174 RepID=A0A547PLH7_9RHOB|nr:DUF2948 family protein [Palleronia caenipelagi]TRD14991.1 DUF2948 family protein [Palleronia caenipelagi]